MAYGPLFAHLFPGTDIMALDVAEFERYVSWAEDYQRKAAGGG